MEPSRFAKTPPPVYSKEKFRRECGTVQKKGRRMESSINICFLSDDAFIQHMTAAAASAADHASRPLVIWLVHPGLSTDSLARIARFEHMYPGLSLHLVQCDLAQFRDYPQFEKWPALIYAKLMLPDLLPADRVIVLDCDVIVMDDPAKIYDLPFPPGVRLAACSDLITQRRLVERGLSAEHYFNAGVMVFDLKALREEHFFPRVLDVPPEVLQTVQCPEQDLMNLYFRGSYLQLDSRWNLFAGLTRRRIRTRFPEKKEALFAAMQSPGIVHFTTRKPWKCALPGSPYDRYYRFYLKRTPFADYRFPRVTWRDILIRLLPSRLAKKLEKKR